VALEHATLTNLDTGVSYEMLFNPSEYALAKENNFAQAAVPGLGSPLLQFVHGSLRTLELELLFDSYEGHRRAARVINAPLSDVRLLTQPVVGLMEINPETHAPPGVLFAWGELTFTGVLTRANQRFTMFLESGVPVRATLAVSLSERKSGIQEAKEVKRRTADYSRLHEVGDDETLALIAARFYGDARKWRPIAIANELEDPRRLPAGLALRLPPLPYRDPVSGEVHR
jgi:Contractile injection system tube protein